MKTKTPNSNESIDKIKADIRQLEQQPLEGSEQSKALAKAYVELSNEYRKIGTFTTLPQAVAAGEQAIHYAEELPLAVDEYRDVLASAYIGLGNAQLKLGTPTDLQQALASYNQAIQLRKALPLDNHEYRNNLAIAYRRYGNAQSDLGTPSDLQQAIESYNQAIKLRQDLPLDNPEYRNDLAAAYMNRGNAQLKLGTPSDLQQAIESYNQAIKLRQDLPLDNPEYRNDLVKAYVNRGSAQLKLGTPSDLQQAIDSYNQAIKLSQELPLDNPEYRNDLVKAYVSRGLAQSDLGTPSDLQQAIESYNQAIKLSQELPLDNPEYRNDLAMAYVNRGIAQDHLGTPSDLQQAIESYNQAIKLSQELPLDNPEYRNDLASTYNNRGLAQADLGTPSDLQQAIESYNQAIKLHQELPLDNPEYRNDLASAYVNRGSAQLKLGTPSDLQQAIESYNQAIKLSQELPLDNPQYRNDLAMAYMNRGNAQADLGTPSDLQQAIDSYNQAITITESLNKYVWQYIELRAKAFGNKSSACLQHGDFEKANEAAEEGLELLRNLEISGVYVLRSWREWLFNITINTYLAMGPHFLTEFLLEHLEPNNEGAAPQSEAMHNAALHALQQLYLMANRGHPEWLFDIQQTLTQLARIRARYFIGTATGAQLMAQYHEENANDIKRAEQTLTDYTKQCPTDVEGYINLANFYRRRQQTATASQIYETAINTVAIHLPKRIDNETLQSVTAMLIKLIDLAADIKFTSAFAQPADSDNARKQMLKHFNSAMDWLNKCSTRLPEKLREAVDLQITQTLKPQFEQKQNEWFDQRETANSQQWQQQEQAKLAQKEQWLLQAAQALPKTVQQVIEALLKMQADLDQLELTSNPAEMSDILARRIQTLIHQLHNSELAVEMEKLAQILNGVWQILDEEDRKFLATALFCLNNDNLLRFVGMSLGSAVEKNLLKRCFYPFREQLQQTNQPLPQENEPEGFEKSFSDFFEKKRELTLGSMVGIIEHVIVKQKPRYPLETAFSQYLFQQPWGISLLESSREKRKKLKSGLYQTRNIRNDCAHPNKTPSRQEIEKMLKNVVTGEQAFMRVFVGAFV
jgi:tetratricopeptide (TPR) repeat protein